MKALQIELNSPQAVRDMVTISQKYPFEISLRSGAYKVDAKSILGVFCFAPNKFLNLEIKSNDCDQLIKELSDFIVN